MNKFKVITTSCGMAISLAASAQASERPNIIFILTDDQPYSLMSYTGNSLIKTPNLDRLAKEGVMFTNANVSSAISTPSRTCILTGRFERSHGVNFNSGTSVSAEGWAECYPNVLRRNGYYTGYIGKNHTPIGDKGYETGLIEKSYDYWYGSQQNVGFYPKEKHSIYKGAAATTQPEVLQEGVLDFLNPNERNLLGAEHFLGHLPDDKPFFLNICFNLPHGSSTSAMKQKDSDPDTYRSLYRDLDIPLPKNYVAREDITTPKLPKEIHHAEDRQTIYDYVDTPEKLRERNIREMQAVTGIDMLVGKLLETLKKEGLDKNTIIVFTSDHGIFNGEFGLGGKSLCYEYCTHVPFIIYDPSLLKRDRKRDSDELILTIDIPATILDYAEVDLPKGYQGESLIPLMKGDVESVRDYLFTENLWSTSFGNPRCESVQSKEWKYIRYYKNDNLSSLETLKCAKEFGIPPKVVYMNTMTNFITYRSYVDAGLNGEPAVYEELFNLKEDPLETTNLAANSDSQVILETLRREWLRKLKFARGEGTPMVDLLLDEVEINK